MQEGPVDVADEVLQRAASIICRGGVVVYPTETVYGLGASAFDRNAVAKIFMIKGRPSSMPISVAVSNFDMIRQVASIDSQEDMQLLKSLLPGPVTVLIRRSPDLPEILTAGSQLIGIRYPDHRVSCRLVELAGPITSTSANLTGQPSPASTAQISVEIRSSVDMIIDAGLSSLGIPSTILDLKSRRILREGAGLEDVKRSIS